MQCAVGETSFVYSFQGSNPYYIKLQACTLLLFLPIMRTLPSCIDALGFAAADMHVHSENLNLQTAFK